MRERTMARRRGRSMPWPEVWSALRDRLTTSSEFRRWASANPLTRGSARRRARALFDLCAGFVYSQVLLACTRLRVFELVREGPLTVAELATRTHLPPDAARKLFDAAAALQLLERRGADAYGLGVHGAALLGNAAVVAMIEHHALLYADLADPVALLRGDRSGTELGRYWAYASAPRASAL